MQEQTNSSTYNNELNSTSDTNDEIQDAVIFYSRYCHEYLAIVICFFGIISNIFNVIVLTRKDMACSPINRILTSLAVADMLLMIEYIPFIYYYHSDLNGEREFRYYGAVYTLFHVHVTQVLHTISVCLTLTLAIWRYLAMGYPEKQRIYCSERRCTIAIISSYVLPVFLCAPSYITLKITAKIIVEKNKVFVLYHTDLSKFLNDNKYLLKLIFWVYAVFLKLLPCVLLTGISIWLIRTTFLFKEGKQLLRSYDIKLLNKNNKNRSMKAERRADRTTKMLIAVLLLFLLTEIPQGVICLLIGLIGKDILLQEYQKYGDVMDILALINGSINFILYCSMNRMFRIHFSKLFTQTVFHTLNNRATPSSTTVTFSCRGVSSRHFKFFLGLLFMVWLVIACNFSLRVPRKWYYQYGHVEDPQLV